MATTKVKIQIGKDDIPYNMSMTGNKFTTLHVDDLEIEFSNESVEEFISWYNTLKQLSDV